MTVIYAASRFTARQAGAAVSKFIERRGFDPMVNFRKGESKPLSLCGWRGQMLAEMVEEAERQVPATAAFIGLYWDDKSDTEAAIFIDSGLLRCFDYGEPPERIGLTVGDAWIDVEFIVRQSREASA